MPTRLIITLPIVFTSLFSAAHAQKDVPLGGGQSQQDQSAPTAEWVQKRDGLWNETQKLDEKGEFGSALVVGQQLLEHQLLYYPKQHPHTAILYERLAQWAEFVEQWEDAKLYRQAVFEARLALVGRGHWQTIDAECWARTLPSGSTNGA